MKYSKFASLEIRTKCLRDRNLKKKALRLLREFPIGEVNTTFRTGEPDRKPVSLYHSVLTQIKIRLHTYKYICFILHNCFSLSF